MMKSQAVVFDLDDTLYPERDYVLSGFRAVAHWMEAQSGVHAERGYAELYTLYEQGVRGDTFNRWLAQHQLDISIADLVTLYRAHIPVIETFPAVSNLLNTLSRHYKLGLLSDGYLVVQQHKLSALGLSEYFDAIVFSDSLGRDAWKPSPQPYQVALQQLQIAPDQAVYVGDNPLKDFLGARRAGMKSIWYHRPEGEYGTIVPPSEMHQPDCVITRLEELPAVLADLFPDRIM